MRGPDPRRERNRPSDDMLRRFLVALHEDVGYGALDVGGGRGGRPARWTATRGEGAAVERTAV